MKPALAAALLLSLLTFNARAEGLGGSLSVGLGIAQREAIQEPPFDLLKLEYDDGRVLKVEGTLAGAGPWMARAQHSRTKHDRLARSGITAAEDIRREETQLALFFTAGDATVGYRLGGGYQHQDDDPPSTSTQGPLVEAGLVVALLPWLELDSATAWMALDKRDADDTLERLELQLSAIARAGNAEYALRIRQFDNHGERGHDDGVLEFSLLAGLRWGAGPAP